MKNISLPDLNYLKSILEYNSNTGEFIWKINKGNKAEINSTAGYLWIDKKRLNNKYYKIKINGKIYRLHRIAYYYITGIDPKEKEIDHINGNSLDNRFNNLRLATNIENAKNKKIPSNNTSGFKGVSWHKASNKWRVKITVNNVPIELGSYKNKLYAALVYIRASKKYFRQWSRT